MANVKFIDKTPLPNIPWQEKPAGQTGRTTERCTDLEIFRESGNRKKSGRRCSPNL